jgi:cytochrome c peroxidase
MKGFLFDGSVMDGFFKTPTLRNIELTGPYMHDGRFKRLDEVIEFYNSGIQAHPQLSEELRIREQGGLTPEHLGPVIGFDFVPVDQGTIPQKMFMTGEEKAALVAFLKTLTDYKVLADEKFSDPFVVE